MMIWRYAYLRQYSTAFLKITGLRLNEFADLLDDMLPCFAAAAQTRLHRTTAVAPAGVGGSRLGVDRRHLAAQALVPPARIMIVRPGDSVAR